MKKLIKEIIGFNNIRDIKSFVDIRNDIELKKALKKNKQFKDQYSGKRCFILGNGPSLKQIDLALLKNEITFTVNQSPNNPQFGSIKTNFHVWTDNRFFNLDDRNPGDMELLQTMKNVRTNDNSPTVFYEYDAKSMVDRYKLDSELDIYYFKETNLRLSGVKWDCDFSKCVPSFSTVIHYIICLAIYMGFSEIILLGCDCTSIINIVEDRIGCADNFEYSFEVSENEKKRREKLQKLSSIRDEMSWQVDMFDNYELLNRLCCSKGIRLLNATKPSLLDSIEAVDLNKILVGNDVERES